MDAAFWHSRWQESRIGFHQDRPTPLMLKHWPSLAATAGERVFVPLCGKSLDMAWFASQGLRVLGVELSPIAIAEFFDEHGLSPTVERSPLGVHHRAGPIEIIEGDAFALDAAALADCSLVFDRAALIALPAELRVRYAERLYAQLPPGCRGLLVTLEYPQHEKAGPPFAVHADEVHTLFGRDWRVDRLEQRDILDTQPAFRDEGVSALSTSVYRMERR
ncbi:thiopurine S-methyltransferase [Lysobacter humi (ex Lee et al. 2017)]